MARYVPLTFDSAIAGPSRIAEPKRSLLRRLFEALVQARQHQADREVARFLATRKKFTDEVEREIERRFLANPR